MFSRNSSLFATWNPPVGWEDCDDLMYEIRFTDNADKSIFFTDTTAQTEYVFHYAAENFFCQIFEIQVLAKYNNVNGELIDSIIFAGNVSCSTYQY